MSGPLGCYATPLAFFPATSTYTVSHRIDRGPRLTDPRSRGLSGPQRKVTATVTGDFLLHQHKTAKTAKVELTFDMDGDAITGLRVKTVEPFAVGLAEHDVRPREAFGRFAQKTLDVLAPKVAKEALVGVTFEAKPGAAKAAVAPKEPDPKGE